MDEKKTSEATAGAASAASTTTKTTKTAEPENKLNTPSVVPGVPNESENALATYLGLDHLISYSRTVVIHDKNSNLLWVFHLTTAILAMR